MRLGAAKDGEFPSPWPQDGYGIGASQPLAPRMEAGRGLLRHLAPVWIAAGQPGSHSLDLGRAGIPGRRPASRCTALPAQNGSETGKSPARSPGLAVVQRIDE